ncbi:MAG: hypothetical protein AAF698_03670 [Pseudomonadota bacterium]
MNTTVKIPALIAVLVFGATSGAHAGDANREQAVANFMQADANADGALTLSEFTILVDLNAEHGIGRASMIKRFGRYGMAFGRLDGNADGLVTPEEMQALSQQARR